MSDWYKPQDWDNGEPKPVSPSPADEPEPEEQARSRWLDELPDPVRVDPLARLFHPTDTTIVFGLGGVGKGNLLAWKVVQLVEQGHTVMLIDYEGHPTEWRARVSSLWTARNRGEAFPQHFVSYVAPLDPSYGYPLGGIYEHAELLTREVERVKADIAVLDSLGVGAMGSLDLSAQTTANVFSAARQRLGIPVVPVSHSPKSKEDSGEHPFGTAYWTNASRATWHVRETSHEGDELGNSLSRLTLTCRKFNDTGQKGTIRQVRVRYVGHRLVEVEEERGAIVAASSTAPLRERVLAVLDPAVGKTAHDIAELLAADRDSVGRKLRGLRHDGLAGMPSQASRGGHRQVWVATPSNPDGNPDEPGRSPSDGNPDDNPDGTRTEPGRLPS